MGTITTLITTLWRRGISAAEVNRKFSEWLREVRKGHSFVVTSRGKQVAKLEPVRDTGSKMPRNVSFAGCVRNPCEISDAGLVMNDWPMKVVLDTNVLAYAEGVNGRSMKDAAIAVIAKLPADSTVLPVQVLGELFSLLVAKAGFSRQRARSAFLASQDSFPVVETSQSVMLAAVELASDHGLKIWDSVVLSAAVSAGCRLLLSQEFEDGFTWSGVTVMNPFAKNRQPLLADLMES